MIIGIPKELGVLKGIEEKRVGLSPAGVRELVKAGARVYVASKAGEGAGFSDEEYRAEGARIAYSNEEVVRRADVVVKVNLPPKDEWKFFNDGATLFSFLYLAVAARDLLKMLVERKLTTIGFEVIREDAGYWPVLRAHGEITGKMAVQVAGRLLESTSGGRGTLLAGIPGIPPADVVIVGAGTTGFHAARSFLGIGASVYVLDRDVARLTELDRLLGGQVVTALATHSNLEKFVSFADVLIGAVLVPGQRAPVIVTQDMVAKMAPGSLVIDLSINEGGCVETSTLTPGEDFLFTRDGVIHFCAPNIPSMVSRTSTHALTNALLPYLKTVVSSGINAALRDSAALRRGLYSHRGFLSDSLPFQRLPKADLTETARGDAS